MNCGFIRYDRLRQIMSEHPSVLDRIRSFSKKRQRSEREKLASSDKLKRSDTLHSLVSDHDTPRPQARATEVLRKELHSGMTEWNWRQRVDGRLDALVRARNRSDPDNLLNHVQMLGAGGGPCDADVAALNGDRAYADRNPDRLANPLRRAHGTRRPASASRAASGLHDQGRLGGPSGGGSESWLHGHGADLGAAG